MSLISELRQYQNTRLALKRFIPLTLFLVVASSVISDSITFLQFGLSFIMSVLLLIQFRLWDDIEDRDFDKVDYPNRVICKTNNLSYFKKLFIVLILLNSVFILVYHDLYYKIICYGILFLVLYFWYRFRNNSNNNRFINAHIILLKYPIIVFLLSVDVSDATSPLVILCLLSVYLVFLIYEILDDNYLRKINNSIYFLSGYLVLLMSIWFAIIVQLYPFNDYFYWLIWLAIIAAHFLLGVTSILSYKKSDVQTSATKYFTLALMAYLTILFEIQL